MRKDSDLSEFIVVRVDIMKAFHYVSRGPQDPTRVDGIKQLRGNFSAWHRLHVDRHHWLVYSTHKTQVKSTPLRFDCQYCRADEINFLLSAMKGFLGDMTYQEAPRLRPSTFWTDWKPPQDP